jgi:hypothetical protein
MSKNTTRSALSRRVSRAIWALFTGVLLTTLVLGVGAASAAPPRATTTTTTATTTTATAPVTTTTPLSSIIAPAATKASNFPTPFNCTPYGSDTVPCYQKYAADPTNLLPAWRWWNGAILINSNPGWNPVTSAYMEIFDFTASLLLGLASLLWFILLATIKYALDLSLVFKAGATINQGFAWLTSSLTSSGVLLLVFFFAALIGFRMFLRGSSSKIFALLLIVLVPVAAMWTLADAVNRSASSPQFGPPAPGASTNVLNVPTGTPAWFAQWGSQIIDQVAGSIATGFGTLAPSDISSNSGTSLSCTQYVDALYGEYNSFSTSAVSASPQNALSASDWTHAYSGASGPALAQASNVALVAASQIWQQAYLQDWVAAQYGSYQQGQNIYCRQLENSVGISPFEQQALTQATVSHPPVGTSVFYLPANSASYEVSATIFAFDACTWQGGKFVPANGWQWFDTSASDAQLACDQFFNETSPLNKQNIQPSGGGVVSSIIHFVSAVTCPFLNSQYNPANYAPGQPLSCTGISGATTAVAGGINLLGKALHGGNNVCSSSTSPTCDGLITYLAQDNTNAALSTEYDAAVSAAHADAAAQNQIAQNYHAMTSYWGQNEAYAVLDGLLALLTAIAFLYSIGALALGTIIAQIGLVIMLILLPATLLLLAVPTKEGKRIRAGTTLLRTTLGFIVSKATLTVVIVLMLEMVLWLEQLIYFGTGPLTGVANALIPLAVLFLMKKLLSAIGMPNLTSLQGALSMPTAAAMALSGSPTASAAVMGGLSKALGANEERDKDGKLIKRARGLNRLDAASKKPLQRTGRAMHSKFTNSKNAAIGFMGLDEMRTQMFGRRDADDNLIELGKMQQINPLVSLLNLAKKGGQFDKFADNEAMLKARPLSGRLFNAYENSNALKTAQGSLAAATAAVEERRERIAATRFKSREQRLAIMKQMGIDANNELIVNQRALKDENGKVVLDADGKPVFAYRLSPVKLRTSGDDLTVNPETGEVLHDGSGAPVYGFRHVARNGVTRDISLAEYVHLHSEDPSQVTVVSEAPGDLLNYTDAMALSPEDRARLTPVTNLADSLNDAAFERHGMEVMEKWGLRDGQVVLSLMGHDAIINPKMADANGRNRILATKKLEGDIEMSKDVLNFLPNEIKARPAGFSDTAYSIYLHMVKRAVGGVDDQGRTVDWALANGIDLSTERGIAELHAAQSGLPSEFDKIQVHLSSQEQRSYISTARDLAKGVSGAQLRRGVNIVWAESANEYTQVAQNQKSALNTIVADLEAQMEHFKNAATTANYMRKETSKVDYNALTASIATMLEERARLATRRDTASSADTADIERLSIVLEKNLENATKNSADFQRNQERLTELTQEMEGYARKMTALSDGTVTRETAARQAAQNLEYMFEFGQAAAGRKGRKGTTDMSALLDMKDIAGKVLQGNTHSRQLEIDELTATLTKLMKDPTADPYAREKQARLLVSTVATINREISRATDESIGLANAVIASGEKALQQENDARAASKNIPWTR